MTDTFRLLDPTDPGETRDEEQIRQGRQALDSRHLPPTLHSHMASAPYFAADATLVDAINVALSLGAPLLLTGEPGTGKTQVAYYLAWYFGTPIHPLHVRSNTTASDLLYHFDAVAYLHAANDPARKEDGLSKKTFIRQGPLWDAFEEEGTSVVLIDEIDKAPRDFPNDLLHVLDQHTFNVRELETTVSRGDRPPPVVVITSNSERRLPEPFLRRSIFHHLVLDEELVQRAVAARFGDFPDLSEEMREAAIRRFFDLRGYDLRKKPATAELLMWLTHLAARGGVTIDQLDGPIQELPALSVLIKDRDDMELVR